MKDNIKRLIEQLEKISGKKVLLEMPEDKRSQLMAYLKTHPGATERQIVKDLWGEWNLQNVRSIRRAVNVNVVREDRTQEPFRYYII